MAVTATAADLQVVEAVIRAKKATIRLTGDQYYRDRVITPSEKQALQRGLDAFAALGGA